MWMNIGVLDDNSGSTEHRPPMCPLNIRMVPEECG